MKPEKIGKLYLRSPSQRRFVEGVHDWWTAAKIMRNDPGEWYLVHRSITRSTATRIRQGVYTAFRPPTDWETFSRGSHGRVELYMAFVGEVGAKERLDLNTGDYLEEDDAA